MTTVVTDYSVFFVLLPRITIMRNVVEWGAVIVLTKVEPGTGVTYVVYCADQPPSKLLIINYLINYLPL